MEEYEFSFERLLVAVEIQSFVKIQKEFKAKHLSQSYGHNCISNSVLDRNVFQKNHNIFQTG